MRGVEVQAEPGPQTDAVYGLGADARECVGVVVDLRRERLDRRLHVGGRDRTSIDAALGLVEQLVGEHVRVPRVPLEQRRERARELRALGGVGHPGGGDGAGVGKQHEVKVDVVVRGQSDGGIHVGKHPRSLEARGGAVGPPSDLPCVTGEGIPANDAHPVARKRAEAGLQLRL